MREIRLLNHRVSWVVIVLLAIVGIFYIYFNFEKANSLVTVEISMDRESALEKAAKLAEEFELGPKEYKQAAAFQNDSRFQNFVELEGGGLDSLASFISKDYYHSYHWSVRHFKEQDANEVTFWFIPNGEIYGFFEKIPESRKGAALLQDEALKLAEHNAIYNWNVDLFPFELVEKSKEEQISGRVDHKFVYERTDKKIGEARFRLTLVVSGDKLTAVDYTVKIPEDFDRRYSEMRSANNTIQMISTAIIALVYGILGVILALFVLIRKRRLVWKPAVYWGLGIAFFSVFLLTLNSLPFAWFAYDTSTSQSNFIIRVLFNGFFGTMGFGAIMALSFMAAEGLGRMAFPNHVQWWKIWSEKSGGSLTIFKQTISGYLFAVIIIAIDVFFYVTTTTYLDWWSPAGTLSDPNILANYVPWLDSISISVQAGFWEEALFRAVPIAGIFVLTKNKRSRNFWIILILFLQTLIFGSAHASYPQQPSYARVFEMIVPFFIMGIIYIYFGILPAVIAHFSVDVFWISLPLWVSESPGIWVDRFFVLFFFLLPLFIVLYFRIKNKKWVKIPDKERNLGWIVPEVPVKAEEQIPTVKSQNSKLEKWLILPGLLGIVIWLIFTPFKNDAPVLTLSKNDAIKMAQNEMKEKYSLNFDDWTILTSVSDKIDIRDIFVWQKGGPENYKALLNNYLEPPNWIVRFVKSSGKTEEKTEEFTVQVLNSGKVLDLIHKLPENRKGKNLTQNQAQIIVDSILISNYNLDRSHLKEISVSPGKMENRTDWEFIYADTTDFPVESGQGRYLVNLSGDEVSKTYSYVYYPEDWIRIYKARESNSSIIRAIGNILVFGIIFFGLVLGIIRWTRRKFKLNVFFIISSLMAFLFALEVVLSWPTFLAEYNTQLPIQNFITTIIISVGISGIFVSLANGIFVAATPGWVPISSQKINQSLYYSFLMGWLVVGIISLSNGILPKTEPSWVTFDFLNSSTPWLVLAVSNAFNILVYPAFAFILFYAVHYLTKGWYSSKIIGISIFLLAGFALQAILFKNYSSWVISGLVVSVFLIVLYVLFFRFHFEWIPVSFGLIPIFKMLREMVIINTPNSFVGGVLMILISFSILIYWQRLLLKYSS